ncbi:hypothetical protein [Corynebacterium kroppenstedtii]|uniref:Uncharacterized protein n=1 Tax=Corynebacterium kroppenstedtii TaxID=161879 RepID=A0A2W5UK66_9CORY|nr:hypothetical protein [Corynebacterium kroppenstedtii]MDU7286305.1 hypothetical protein [Corynebacterium kroppenstedtii]PZR03674.1 MAG: hypothetical protein DI525_09270 [Corynebacterium kroppenstedtii]
MAHENPANLYTGGITEFATDRVGASSLTTTGKVSDWHKNWSTRNDEFKRIIDRILRMPSLLKFAE